MYFIILAAWQPSSCRYLKWSFLRGLIKRITTHYSVMHAPCCLQIIPNVHWNVQCIDGSSHPGNSKNSSNEALNSASVFNKFRTQRLKEIEQSGNSLKPNRRRSVTALPSRAFEWRRVSLCSKITRCCRLGLFSYIDALSRSISWT